MSCEHDIIFEITDSDDVSFDIDVRDFVDRIVAPDEYSGATEVTPSDSEQVLPTKDKTVRSDITINPVSLGELTVDALTTEGTIIPTGSTVGFSSVTVEEDWDGTLYPITDETDPLYESKVINAKHIPVVAGDTVIIDGMGRGRWFGWYRGNKGGAYSANSVTNNILTEGFTSIRYVLPITVDATLILAGYEWTTDGTHSGNATYCFFGDYLHWKVIHAS